jgi:tetratricopeptide (TPR) repeat protein
MILQPYLDLIAQYRAGEIDKAVATLLKWSEHDVKGSVDTFLERAADAGGMFYDTDEAYGAVMLHTDAAFQAIRLDNDAAGNFNIRTAAGLLGAVTVATPDERQRCFDVPTWHLTVARVLNGLCAWEPERSLLQAYRREAGESERHKQALRMADHAAQLRPGQDAQYLLAIGSVEEGYVHVRQIVVSLAEDVGQMSTSRAIPERANLEALLREAGGYFREAMIRDSFLYEARVRLGHVLMLTGRSAEAIVQLTGVLDAGAGPSDAYLARLFLGQIAEDRKEFARAIEYYQRALTGCGECSTARVALASVRERTGDIAGARNVIRALFDLARGAEAIPDPWPTYWLGQYREGAVDLERLRQSVSSKKEG